MISRPDVPAPRQARAGWGGNERCPGHRGTGQLSRMPSMTGPHSPACPRPSQESQAEPAVKAVPLGGPHGSLPTVSAPGGLSADTLSTCCWRGAAPRSPSLDGSPGPRETPPCGCSPGPALWASVVQPGNGAHGTSCKGRCPHWPTEMLGWPWGWRLTPRTGPRLGAGARPWVCAG